MLEKYQKGDENMGYYDLCCRYQGRVVRISDNRGRTHIGKINRVTRNHVHISPIGNRGFGYGGFGWGYGWGAGYGIALGAITGVALAALFW